jgi:hypothetical protein
MINGIVQNGEATAIIIARIGTEGDCHLINSGKTEVKKKNKEKEVKYKNASSKLCLRLG